MGFIRRVATMSYEREIRQYTDIISKDSLENRGRFLVYSVWLRSILHLEGLWPARKDNEGNILPALNMYPIMLGRVMKIQQALKKRTDGGESKAFVLGLWIHTLRAIIRPELLPLAQHMWKILLDARAYWDGSLKEQEDEDNKLGIEKEFLMKTARLSKSIIEILPPSQLFRK